MLNLSNKHATVEFQWNLNMLRKRNSKHAVPSLCSCNPQNHAKTCKRLPLECINKCGIKDIPREEVITIEIYYLSEFQKNKDNKLTVVIHVALQWPSDLLRFLERFFLFVKVDIDQTASSRQLWCLEISQNQFVCKFKLSWRR